MTIRIGSNIASLTAQRRLGEADSALSKTFERLSSGQRINRASDDAAGLAIADDLKAKGRIYAQGIRNGNDGISLLNIADSAIDALTGVVTRIRELSEQAANGTYSNKQREALDNEAQELSKEFTRITQTTSFNGIKLFNGSLGQGVRLQLGVGITESISASVGGAIGTGSFSQSTSYSLGANVFQYALDSADINGDGIIDLVSGGENSGNALLSIQLGAGDGSFQQATTRSYFGSTITDLKLGDLNGDGILDLISTNYHNPSNTSFALVHIGRGDGSFDNPLSYQTSNLYTASVELGDVNGDGILDLVTGGTSQYDENNFGEINIRLGNGNGTFGDIFSSYYQQDSDTRDLKINDVNGDGVLDIVTVGSHNGFGRILINFGNGDGTFGSVAFYTTDSTASAMDSIQLADINNDNLIDIITTGGFGVLGGSSGVRLGIGGGVFGSSTRYTMNSDRSIDMVMEDINGDSFLDMIAVGRNGTNAATSVRIGNGDGTFQNLASYNQGTGFFYGASLADFNGDGVLDLATVGSVATATRLSEVVDGTGSLIEFSLRTKADALQSMGMLDRTLQNLARQRGTIGASQSRVNVAISNLQTARENFSAAESRIRDADVASESANLIRTQILQQAAASVLSQANQQPQLALQLLR